MISWGAVFVTRRRPNSAKYLNEMSYGALVLLMMMGADIGAGEIESFMENFDEAFGNVKSIDSFSVSTGAGGSIIVDYTGKNNNDTFIKGSVERING